MTCIKYPSIEQFRNVVQNVKQKASYVGKDENGNAIYDGSAKMPTIKFKGTVKLHGTNAGVTFDCSTGEFYAQSRENIITPEKDNAGFATFVYANKEFFSRYFETVKSQLSLKDEFITVYGEWAGKGIQKGVAVSELPKAFYIFGVKITPTEGSAYWTTHEFYDVVADETSIFIIEQFTTYEIDIDFNEPQMIQNDLVNLTIAVEDKCPVGAHFGVEGSSTPIEFTVGINNNIICNKNIPLPVKNSINALLNSSKLNIGETYSIDFMTD